MNETLSQSAGSTEEVTGRTNQELIENIISDKKNQIEAANRVLEMLKDGLENLGTKPTQEEAEAIRATANYYARVKLEAEEYLKIYEENKDNIEKKKNLTK